MDVITETSETPPRKSSMLTPTTSISMSSPVASVFSRGHSAKGSGSSIASSPIPRDSFDLYTSRLGKVTEEPLEKDDSTSYSFDYDRDGSYDQYFTSDRMQTSPRSSTVLPEYSLGEQDEWDMSSGQQRPKRQRSCDNASSVSNRLSSRFNSISRRWRNRSGASPQLSVVTHISAPVSRNGSAASSRIMSPALSAISRHESYLPPSPTRTNLDDSFHGSDALSIPDTRPLEEEEEAPLATTPLLPPVFSEVVKKDSPVHSPLQSPSIAPTQTPLDGRISMDGPALASLPSPPLSTKPSLVSIRQRSRANTATAANPIGEVPVLQMLDEHDDPWASQLGHADFSIHPEPYLPGVVDLDSYTEFRANWDQARTNYSKHLARTIEHYGSTSRVFRLTEEKWNSIDAIWKSHNQALSQMLAPSLNKKAEIDASMSDSYLTDAVLEKPITRIIIPDIERKSGKFPELGDGDIVGPMEVAPPRAASMTRNSPQLSPLSPTRKRNLFKFLQDMFGRP